jgi:hypothetical protein
MKVPLTPATTTDVILSLSKDLIVLRCRDPSTPPGMTGFTAIHEQSGFESFGFTPAPRCHSERSEESPGEAGTGL